MTSTTPDLSVSLEYHTSIVEALHTEYKQELAKAHMQLALYRSLLIQAGIEPPDKSGEELLSLWEECRNLINTTHEFVMRMGPSKELLMNWG